MGMTNTNPPVKWLPILEAVAELGIPERTLRRMVSQNKIGSMLHAGKRLVEIRPDADTETEAKETRVGMLALVKSLDQANTAMEAATKRADHAEARAAMMLRTGHRWAFGWAAVAAVTATVGAGVSAWLWNDASHASVALQVAQRHGSQMAAEAAEARQASLDERERFALILAGFAPDSLVSADTASGSLVSCD